MVIEAGLDQLAYRIYVQNHMNYHTGYAHIKAKLPYWICILSPDPVIVGILLLLLIITFRHRLLLKSDSLRGHSKYIIALFGCQAVVTFYCGSTASVFEVFCWWKNLFTLLQEYFVSQKNCQDTFLRSIIARLILL